MVPSAGLEPAAFHLGDGRSIQMSYEGIWCVYCFIHFLIVLSETPNILPTSAYELSSTILMRSSLKGLSLTTREFLCEHGRHLFDLLSISSLPQSTQYDFLEVPK